MTDDGLDTRDALPAELSWLPEAVRLEGDELQVRRPPGALELAVGLGAPFASLGMVAVGLTGMFDLLGPGTAPVLAVVALVMLVMLALVALAVGLGGVFWATRPRWVRVGPHGVSGGGMFDAPIARPTEVRLHGEVGKPVEVSVLGGQRRIRLARGLPSLTGTGWTYDQLVSLARVSGERLGVEVKDTLDHDGWQRWHGDPSERVRVAYENRYATSLARFERWHRIEPAEPPRIVYDHHGLKVYGITVTEHELCYRSLRVPLADLIEVRAAFTPRQQYDPLLGRDEQETAATLLIRTRDQKLAVGATRVTPEVAAGFHWLAERLSDKLLLATHADEGSVADVLRELVELGRRAREPVSR